MKHRLLDNRRVAGVQDETKEKTMGAGINIVLLMPQNHPTVCLPPARVRESPKARMEIRGFRARSLDTASSTRPVK